MLQKDLLNGCPQLQLFPIGFGLLKRPIKAGAAYLRQLTHPLHADCALQRHHFPDVGVDVLPPELFLWRRLASILCKAPLKKSSSRVLSANTRFSRPTSFSSSPSRDFAGRPGARRITLSGSICSRQR